MIDLIIDTCVWIDLCKKLPELRKKITLLIEQKKVRLILPTIILEEWNRQKPRIIEKKNQSFRGMIKNARLLSEYLDASSAENLKKILDEFQGEKSEIISLACLQEIEYIFNFSTTVILEITDTAKLQAVDFALDKKAPFQYKNSMADALIIFCAAEFEANEGKDNCIFVSSNTKDFSSSLKVDEIHEDLRDLFEKTGIRYFTNIGLAINEVETNLVSAEDIQQVEITVKLDAIQETLNIFQDYNRQLMESIEGLGGLSAMQEASRGTMEAISVTGGLSAMQEASRGMVEAISVTGGLLAMQEASRVMMEAISVTGGISAMQEASRVMMEAIGAVGGSSAMNESLHAIHDHDHRLAKTSKRRQRTRSHSKTNDEEISSPNHEEDGDINNPQGS